MKTLKIFIALLAFSTSVAHAQFTKAELQVSGLTCSMCSKATEKSLRTLGFIGDVKADLNRNLFVLTFKNNAPVSLDQINKKVKGAGFSVSNLKATFNFTNVKITDKKFNYGGESYHIVSPLDKEPEGLATFTVVNKGFAPVSVYKKYSSAFNNNTKTGNVYYIAI
jgi:copper chaperone CopZ